MIGETVGSYKIIAKLGEGGMGEVYLAEHKYIARRAAVKFLLPELTASADVVNRFFAEARAASLIEHPGIVEVLDCEVHTDGRAFIVMEFLNGESLRGYIDRVHRFDGDQPGGLAICRQMASALTAAHDQGIVHRDLKPDNVFLHLPSGRAPEDPVVKLLDFGIAKLHGGPEGGSKTRTGQLLGTPLYMSPEQCRGGRQVDARSDIYSLGCIMFEMFCGRPPFVAEGFGELIYSHISEPPPDPLTLAPTLAPAVRDVLLRCLEKAPDRRPQTMAEVSTLLGDAGAKDALRLRTPVVRGRTDAPGARSPGWVPSPPPIATPAGLPRTRPMMPAATPGTMLLPPGGVPRGQREPTLAPTTLSGSTTELGVTNLRRRGGGLKLVVVGAALAGAAVAGVLIMRARGTDAAPPAEEAAPRASAAARPVQDRAVHVDEPEPPARAPSRESASIKLTGLPDGATVRLDGRPARPPLVVPRGSQDHRIAVEAEGYEPWEQTVEASADQTVAVRLKPKAAEPASPGAAPRPKHNKPEHHHANNPNKQFDGFSDLY